MKRYNFIIESNTAPENKHVIWLHKKVFRKYINGRWSIIGINSESGTISYKDLSDKPTINGMVLDGDITVNAKVDSIENSDIDKIL